MESLDFTYNLVDLKIESKAPVQIYFMSQFQNVDTIQEAFFKNGNNLHTKLLLLYCLTELLLIIFYEYYQRL